MIFDANYVRFLKIKSVRTIVTLICFVVGVVANFMLGLFSRR